MGHLTYAQHSVGLSWIYRKVIHRPTLKRVSNLVAKSKYAHMGIK